VMAEVIAAAPDMEQKHYADTLGELSNEALSTLSEAVLVADYQVNEAHASWLLAAVRKAGTRVVLMGDDNCGKTNLFSALGSQTVDWDAQERGDKTTMQTCTQGYWSSPEGIIKVQLLQPHSRAVCLAEGKDYDQVLAGYREVGWGINLADREIAQCDRTPRVFIILFDLTTQKGLANLNDPNAAYPWALDIKKHCEQGDYNGIVLVGTKLDCWEEKQAAGEQGIVTWEDTYKMAKAIGAKGLCWVSAKTLDGIDAYTKENGEAFSADGLSLKQQIKRVSNSKDLPIVHCQRS